MRILDLMVDSAMTSKASEWAAVGHPMRRLSSMSSSFTLCKSLDAMSRLEMRMRRSLAMELFPKGVSTECPIREINILALVCDDDLNMYSIREVPFYRGILDEMRLIFSDRNMIEFRFVDPLIATAEQDGSEEFHGRCLKDIFSKILSNSFKRASFEVVFLTPAPENVRTTNRDMSDFEFISQLSRDYGFRFFYQSKNDQHQLVFFQPDYTVKPVERVDVTAVRVESFSRRRHQLLDAVVATGFSGEEVRIREGDMPQLGEAPKGSIRDRSQSGIELISHFCLPNASSLQDVHLRAKAKYLNAAWDQCCVRYFDNKLMSFGELFEVSGEDALEPVRGRYLLRQCTIVGGGRSPSILYEGVRP